MNLGLLMGVSSSSVPASSQVSSSANAKGAGFGSVFQSLMGASQTSDAQQSPGKDIETNQLMEGILQAETLEELAGILEQLKQGEQTSRTVAQLLQELGQMNSGREAETLKETLDMNEFDSSKLSSLGKVIDLEVLDFADLSNLEKFPSLQQLAALISENPDKLVEVMTKALENSGVTDDAIIKMQATGDIWFVLETLQNLPPVQLIEAIQQLPEKATLEITAFFKAIELIAPKMDLFVRQEDLIRTIQPLLSQFASHLEGKVVPAEGKQTIQLPASAQSIIRFAMEQPTADTKQQEQQTRSNEAPVLQSAITQTEGRPTFQMTQTEKVPESRSEALMREFQAILNRANFGQTGGTNRLMVKLYPEHLGQVRIELLEINGVMTARILASTAMAREMLDSQIHQLRHAFNQQNLQVERIDLSQTIQEPSKNDREQAFNKQNEQQKEQLTEQDQNQDEQERTFEEFMIELEV
ncbi:flagellar hook-length control protein FliK [Sporosarcina aquimarina]|uniref:flagellar hook-length control protein FliK n=1 Tax=Sporosarcina aquimarina TaxID=114975 RepID=UPI001C8D062B|nr:flagellar hook-length control protein FliK [Sporosarcina aquimarina]